jgi:hypothetical protein
VPEARPGLLQIKKNVSREQLIRIGIPPGIKTPRDGIPAGLGVRPFIETERLRTFKVRLGDSHHRSIQEGTPGMHRETGDHLPGGR